MAKKGMSLTWMVVKPFILLLLPFFIMLNIMPGPNGQPMFSWYQDAQSWVASLKNANDLPQSFSISQPAYVELYRWQDDKGLWHFSQDRPKTPYAVEAIKVSTTLSNIMPKPKDTQLKTGNSSNTEAITPFNVLQKAKALQKTAKNRNQVLDSL